MAQDSDTIKLPLQGLQQQVFALVFEAVNEAEGGYDARRHRAEEFTSRVLDLVNSTQQSKREVKEPGRFGDLVYELRNEADELGVYFDSVNADCRDAVDVMYLAADELERRNKQAFGRSNVPIQRVLALIAGKPNDEMIAVGDVRVAAMVGNVTDADIQRGIELAKEHGW